MPRTSRRRSRQSTSRRCAATSVFWRAIFWKVADRDRAGTNWHSILEQTYGLFNGIGIGVALHSLARRAPPLGEEPLAIYNIFCADWMRSLLQLAMDNVGFEGGRDRVPNPLLEPLNYLGRQVPRPARPGHE